MWQGWSSEASTAFPANAFLAAPDSSSGFEVTFEEVGDPAAGPHCRFCFGCVLRRTSLRASQQ